MPDSSRNEFATLRALDSWNEMYKGGCVGNKEGHQRFAGLVGSLKAMKKGIAPRSLAREEDNDVN